VPDEIINGRDNLVRIPRYKHWAINSWYEKPNPAYGGLRPREWLKGKSWKEQRKVGLQVLRDVGVLKP
jgi:hypothetical protein